MECWPILIHSPYREANSQKTGSLRIPREGSCGIPLTTKSGATHGYGSKLYLSFSSVPFWVPSFDPHPHVRSFYAHPKRGQHMLRVNVQFASLKSAGGPGTKSADFKPKPSMRLGSLTGFGPPQKKSKLCRRKGNNTKEAQKAKRERGQKGRPKSGNEHPSR